MGHGGAELCLILENNEDGAIAGLAKQNKQFAAWEQGQRYIWVINAGCAALNSAVYLN